jgi:peptide-methionine (S)-S-oxide reductase
MGKEQATFAAGCFWGIEKAFALTSGVLSTRVGYTGGHTVNPTYQDVCAGDTNHAEAVLVTFDTDIISYNDLLALFWRIHDPTQLNRQGWDVGTQYRSAIFYHSDTQKEAALTSKEALEASGVLQAPIVTRIEKAEPFFEAEAYHQRYWETHPVSCHI